MSRARSGDRTSRRRPSRRGSLRCAPRGRSCAAGSPSPSTCCGPATGSSLARRGQPSRQNGARRACARRSGSRQCQIPPKSGRRQRSASWSRSSRAEPRRRPLPGRAPTAPGRRRHPRSPPPWAESSWGSQSPATGRSRGCRPCGTAQSARRGATCAGSAPCQSCSRQLGQRRRCRRSTPCARLAAGSRWGCP